MYINTNLSTTSVFGYHIHNIGINQYRWVSVDLEAESIMMNCRLPDYSE